jgi:cell pole-organizing protein PopZ
MEEILASIRRIIADDDPAKGPPKASEPPPRPAAPPPRPAAAAPRPPAPVAESQKELDAMLAQLQAKSQPAPQPVEGPASDSLDLTEQMAAPEPAPTPGFRTIDGQSDIVFEERAPEPPPPSEPPAPPRAMEPPPRRPHDDGGEGGEHGLVSAATTAAVDSAFNTLAQTVPVQNGRTLEDLVKEMLRPQLKTWLDDNLPGMVERLVRAEIERVSRGRG